MSYSITSHRISRMIVKYEPDEYEFDSTEPVCEKSLEKINFIGN